MKRSILLTLPLVLCLPLFAIEVDPKLDKAVRDAIPVCAADATITYEAAAIRLPPRFRGAMAKIESARHRCDEEYVAVLSPGGNFYLGGPWVIENEDGKTVEQKLRSFTQRNLRETMTVSIEPKPTDDGLFPVTLTQTTEAGKLPLLGHVDAEGRIFFFGAFRNLRESLGAQRTKAFQAYLGSSPSKGAADGAVTVIEFSDFQCPSCRYASGYADAILAQHGDKVRYIRFDLPLSGHPWAFPAALAGRAIHRQKPELFWDYKKNVYENQDKLNAFTFWDWARAWAEDHEIDLARYDADLQSAEIKNLILGGVGTAFSNDVRATPTYMVNGVVVDPGDDGKALTAYVAKMVR